MPASDIVIGATTFALTVLGAVVAVNPPEKHQLWLKFTYVSAFILIGLVGFVYVIKLSNEAAKSNSQLSQNVLSVQQETADISRVQDLNTRLQRQLVASSATISALARQNLIATTGGDEFCWLTPTHPLPVGLGGNPNYQGDDWWQLALWNSGKVVLPTCDLRFSQLPTAEEVNEHRIPNLPDLVYHFDKVPIMVRSFRSTNYYIRGDRTYTGIIDTPTRRLNEIIGFKPDPNGRPRATPTCWVATQLGNVLVSECNPSQQGKR